MKHHSLNNCLMHGKEKKNGWGESVKFLSKLRTYGLYHHNITSAYYFCISGIEVNESCSVCGAPSPPYSLLIQCIKIYCLNHRKQWMNQSSRSKSRYIFPFESQMLTDFKIVYLIYFSFLHSFWSQLKQKAWNTKRKGSLNIGETILLIPVFCLISNMQGIITVCVRFS